MTRPNPPSIGEMVQIMPGLRLLLAPNPSAMTLHGTNTYLVGEGEIAVIDPGPPDRAHLAALLGKLGPGERISHILVTHAHLDHSALARPLAEATGARIYAFGDATAGRSAQMQALVGQIDGGEGVDATFAPDICLQDGASLAGRGWHLTALHTPGHMGNHLCFRWGDIVFSGDHVMGWASTLVSPPDGDMNAYMSSLGRLENEGARWLLPGHGSAITTPTVRIAELRAHRLDREAQILRTLAKGASNCARITAELYTDTAPRLQAAARRNVLAHLIDLQARGLVRAAPATGPEATYTLSASKP